MRHISRMILQKRISHKHAGKRRRGLIGKCGAGLTNREREEAHITTRRPRDPVSCLRQPQNVRSSVGNSRWLPRSAALRSFYAPLRAPCHCWRPRYSRRVHEVQPPRVAKACRVSSTACSLVERCQCLRLSHHTGRLNGSDLHCGYRIGAGLSLPVPQQDPPGWPQGLGMPGESEGRSAGAAKCCAACFGAGSKSTSQETFCEDERQLLTHAGQTDIQAKSSQSRGRSSGVTRSRQSLVYANAIFDVTPRTR